MNDLPIACELSPRDLAERRESLLARLVARARRIEPLEAGIRFEFPGDAETARTILAAIDAERRCCRFLRFELVFAQDLGPVSLDITGPAGTREFLESVLPLPS